MISAEQKDLIRMYRLGGHSYANIGRLTGLPESTVRSYCYRCPELNEKMEVSAKAKLHFCQQCGASLPVSRFRPRHFCSDRCRSKYWSVHAPYAVSRQAMVQCTCKRCGKQFRDYAKRDRKYCSQACYLADRYAERRGDQ